MNAERNPFRSSRIEALPFRFVDGSLDAVLDAFERNARRGAIVGPPGSGKTTLLRELVCRLPPPAFLLIDGWELATQLRRLLVRLAARRRRAGLLVASHAECGLPVVHRCRTSERLALDLLSELCPHPDEELRRRMLERFTARGGDVRAALHDLDEEA